MDNNNGYYEETIGNEYFQVRVFDLLDTPSRKDKIDEKTENMLRVYGCELIQRAGILLKCPQSTMAIAQVLFQRFYYRTSFAIHDVRHSAMAALYLSCKIGETPKKLRDACNVFNRIYQRENNLPLIPLDVTKQEYWELKDTFISYEHDILKELGFIVVVVHPHKFILNFSKIIEGSKEMSQIAWNFANDSLRTTVCVRFPPEVVAVSCIFMAARTLKISLPEKPRPWWELFDVDFRAISEISRTVLSLYRAEKPHYVPISIWAKEQEEKKKKEQEEQKAKEEAALEKEKKKEERSKRSKSRSPRRRSKSRSPKRSDDHRKSTGDMDDKRRHRRSRSRSRDRKRHRSRSRDRDHKRRH